MAALIGRHINKIDTKGRVSVPKPFREALSISGLKKRLPARTFSGIYVFRSFKYRAIEGCGEEFIQRVVDSLDDLELFSDVQDDLAITLLENTYQLTCDTEGRVLFPPELIEYASLSNEAMFVGRGSRFQVWQPDAYKSHNSKVFKRVGTQGATLSLKNIKGFKQGNDK
jgi:MraZ protein